MHRNPLSPWLLAAVAVVLLGLVAGGIWFYRTQEQELREHKENELQAIAQLKVQEIAIWRAERLGDAAILSDSPLFIEGVAHWLLNPQAGAPEAILTQFRALQEHYHYADVLLVDPDGNIRLSLSGRLEPLHAETVDALAGAFNHRQPIMTDIHPDPGEFKPHIDVVAPLFANNASAAEPVGGIILQSDASQFLYPLIQSWPTPSDSAETLVIRRDGDSVLFLNALRFQPDAALGLRVPLSQTEVPAVKAVLDTQGVVEGNDYRGVEVLAALQAVPDSPWFVVAKVDKAEILAEWRLRSRLILGLIAGAVVVVGAVGTVVWQRHQKRHFQTLLEVEQARHESETRYQTILMSIGDAVIVTDAAGQVALLNPVAEALTGWSMPDAQGRGLEEVFHIIDEDTRQPVENPVRRVVREGTVVGLANHTLLITKDGRDIPIADSGAPTRARDGTLTGVVLVFRDQTQERAAQQVLRDSEAYIRTILDNLPVGVAVNSVDPTVTFSYMNDNFVKFYRTTRAALAETDAFWEAVYEEAEFRETIKRRVLEDIASGDPERMYWEDVPITRQGAGTTYISARNTPIYGQQLMLSTVWDTTERKRAEEELRKLSHAVEHSPSIIYITGSDGRLEYVNPKFTAITGYTAAEAAGRLPRLLDPSRISAEAYEERWRTIRSGGEWRGEFKNYKKSGEVFWESASISSIKDESGAIAHLVIVIEDITERKRAEQRLLDWNEELEQRVIERTAALNHAKERVEAILNSSYDVTILCRTDGAIDQVNPAFETTFGRTSEAVFSHSLTTLAHSEHAPLLQQAFETAVQTQQPERLEITVLSPERQAFDADVVLSPVTGPNQHLLGVVCSLRDITERKLMEAQLRRMLEHEMELGELKSRYVSMAAHDLRNPLAVIQSAVNLIERFGERMAVNEKQVKFNRIQTSIQVMVAMLDDILTLGKADAGKLTFHPAPLDLNAFCQNMVTETSQAAGGSSRVAFLSQGECHKVILDVSLLRHILGNLLSNALKYSPEERPVTFEVACAPDRITFRVQDQGIGIPASDQKRLFEPFHRAGNTGQIPGTGLGLAIVKQSVDLHGGTITCDSQENVGTTFTVILPQVPSGEVNDEDAGR